MPYIDQDARDRLDVGKPRPQTPGELNYAITKLLVAYLPNPWDFSYSDLATVTGVLENVKSELYRRVATPYEEEKKLLNGDVF